MVTAAATSTVFACDKCDDDLYTGIFECIFYEADDPPGLAVCMDLTVKLYNLCVSICQLNELIGDASPSIPSLYYKSEEPTATALLRSTLDHRC